MQITVVDHITLDGVVQAPAVDGEDTRDGFTGGGWAVPFADEVMGEFMGRMAEGGGGAMLFGRWTYEHLYDAWHGRTDDNPFTDMLDQTPKYVASRTLTEPLVWENAILLAGEATEAVAELKADDGPDLTILGSGVLVRSLLGAGLIDHFVLTIHPLLLGSGHRLFADGGAAANLELVESIPTTTGVIIASYRVRH
jgi:dihydrofolate reductase